MYALVGSMKIDVRDERSEVHCLSANLSEQDLDSVGGASPRAGFRLTIPVREKQALPSKDASALRLGVLVEGVGVFHAEVSFWAAIVSSILASPPIKVRGWDDGNPKMTYMVLLSSTYAVLHPLGSQRAAKKPRHCRICLSSFAVYYLHRLCQEAHGIHQARSD